MADYEDHDLLVARHEVVAVLGPHAVSSIFPAPVAVLAARRVAGHEEVVVLVVGHGYGFGRWGCPRRVARDCKTAGVPFVVASPARDGWPAGTRTCGRGEGSSFLRDRTYAYAKGMRPPSVAHVPHP